MSRHVGNDGNEITGQLTRQGSLHPLVGPEPASGISTNIARGVIRDWLSGKHEEHCQSIHGRMETMGYLRKTSPKIAAELLSLSRNQLQVLTGYKKGTVI